MRFQNLLKIKRYYGFVFSIVLTMSFAGNASAQDQQSTIEQRVESLSQQLPSIFIRPDEKVLTGREDLVLLIKRKLFEAYISPSYQFTNNVFLSNNNRDSDDIFTLNGGLRFSTLVANKVNLFADFSVTGARYSDQSQLNYNAIQGALGVGYMYGVWSTSLSYSPSFVYADDFGDHLVSLHRISASVSRSFMVKDNIVVSPYIVAQVTPSDPNEFGFYQANAGVQAVVGLRPDLKFSVGPRIYTKRYFDFFESQTGEERRDSGAGFSAQLNWTPHKNVSVSADMSFTSNNSTLDNNTYDAFTVSPVVRLSVRF